MPYYNKALNYPVPTNEAWNIQDSSKIKDAMSCWRGYFFKHVLGWQIDRPNIHLIFGSAWHEALAFLHLEGFESKNVQEAYNKHFLPYYRMFIDQSEDEIYLPKTPERAYLALAAYALRRQKDARDYSVVYHNEKPMIEIGGKINLSNERQMCFKMDTILRGPRGIISREHKTGSSTWNWDMQWHLSVQIGTYSHVLYCLYPENEVAGVIVDGTFFKKTKPNLKLDTKDPLRHFAFLSVPIYKSPAAMNWWLNNTIWWLDMVEWNFDLLSKCSDNDAVMHAFPPNPESCTKYFGCDYLPFCMAWANPLRHLDQIPIGFKQEFWSPLAEASRVNLDIREGI